MTSAIALVVALVTAGLLVDVLRRQRRLRRRQKNADEAHKRAWYGTIVLGRAVGAFAARRALAAAGRSAGLPLRFMSNGGEDVILWELFEERLDGVFLEVGAYNGVEHSVTYVFEAAGWTGVLIEPQPGHAEVCRRNRPGSTVVCAALTAPGREGSGTLTIVRDDTIGETLSFLEHAEHKQERVLRGYKDRMQRIEVRLTTMEAVLPPDLPRIDFAVIDVEGAEIDLLKGFDLERRRPRALVVEAASPEAAAALRAHLSPRGYSTAGWLGVNLVFIHNDEAELLARARWLMVPD